MPLKIDLKPGDKIIINGAVLQNAGGNAKLLVHNDSAILRGKEVMADNEVTSPAAHVYFALQCAYMFPDKTGEYLERFGKLADDFLKASPSSAAIIAELAQLANENHLYKALKACQKLLKHEARLMDAARTAQRRKLEAAPDAVQQKAIGADSPAKE